MARTPHQLLSCKLSAERYAMTLHVAPRLLPIGVVLLETFGLIQRFGVFNVLDQVSLKAAPCSMYASGQLLAILAARQR